MRPQLFIAFLLACIPASSLCAADALTTRDIKLSAKRDSNRSGWEERWVDVKVNWLEIEKAKTPALKTSVDKWLASELNLAPNKHVKKKVLTQEAAVQAYMSGCIAGWSKDSLETQKNSSCLMYEFTAKAKVLYQGAQWVTVGTEFYFFTGGIHGNARSRLASFDIASGKRFDVAGNLMPSGDKKLKELATRYLRIIMATDEKGVVDKAALAKPNKDVFLLVGADGLVALPKEMGLVSDGLRMQYNEYEVSSYSFGSPCFTVPWAELKGIFKGGVK